MEGKRRFKYSGFPPASPMTRARVETIRLSALIRAVVVVGVRTRGRRGRRRGFDAGGASPTSMLTWINDARTMRVRMSYIYIMARENPS